MRRQANAATAALIIALLAVAAPVLAETPKPPGTVVLGSLSKIYQPVTFNHENHALMAADCGACHHQHGLNAALPCKDCHAVNGAAFKTSVTSSFMPCSGCHAAADRETPAVPGLKVALHRACMRCHRGMGNVGQSPKGCVEICHARAAAAAMAATK